MLLGEKKPLQEHCGYKLSSTDFWQMVEAKIHLVSPNKCERNKKNKVSISVQGFKIVCSAFFGKIIPVCKIMHSIEIVHWHLKNGPDKSFQ